MMNILNTLLNKGYYATESERVWYSVVKWILAVLTVVLVGEAFSILFLNYVWFAAAHVTGRMVLLAFLTAFWLFV